MKKSKEVGEEINSRRGGGGI